MKRIIGTGCLVVWAAVSYAALNGQQPRTVWEGVYTIEQAKRGEAQYGQHCAACHGGTLLGAEAAPALTGFEFGGNWNMLTVGDLYERIRTSMPVDDPGKVTAQQKVDIIAYMLQIGGFPAGAGELPRDAQLLTQIQYLSTRP